MSISCVSYEMRIQSLPISGDFSISIEIILYWFIREFLREFSLREYPR